MISVNDFRTGVTIEYEDHIWQVMEFQHIKQARGAAIVRTKLRNLRNDNIQDKTFRSTERVKRARIDNKNMQYLYASGTTHAFMDMQTFEQIEIDESMIEQELNFIKENVTVNIMMYDGEVLGIDLPNNVELEVVETEPGIKGDTVSGGSKAATLETGYTVQVPLFINEGDLLVISTEDGRYISRKN